MEEELVGAQDGGVEDAPQLGEVVDDVTAAAIAAGLMPLSSSAQPGGFTHASATAQERAPAPHTAAMPGEPGSAAIGAGTSGSAAEAGAGAVVDGGSSSDTSDMSDDDMPAPAGGAAGATMLPGDDEEQIVPAGQVLRTKNEIAPEPTVIPESVPIEGDIEKLGQISAMVEETIVIQAAVGPPALDEGTVICLEDKSPLGAIAEIFGPIQEPLYLIRFTSADEVAKIGEKAPQGSTVYYAVQSSKAVNHAACHVKGSDASNIFDEEPAEDEMEYSDDEEEAEARKKIKEKKGLNKRRQNDVAVENAESVLTHASGAKGGAGRGAGRGGRYHGDDGGGHGGEQGVRGGGRGGRGGAPRGNWSGAGDGSGRGRGGVMGGNGRWRRSGGGGGEYGDDVGQWDHMGGNHGGFPPMFGGDWGGGRGRGGDAPPFFTPDMFAGPPTGMPMGGGGMGGMGGMGMGGMMGPGMGFGGGGGGFGGGAP